jgi:hypothetical protein
MQHILVKPVPGVVAEVEVPQEESVFQVPPVPSWGAQAEVELQPPLRGPVLRTPGEVAARVSRTSQVDLVLAVPVVPVAAEKVMVRPGAELLLVR